MLRDWIFNAALLLGLSDVCDYIEYLDDVRQQEEIKKADPDVLVDPIEEVIKPREFDLMVHFSNIVLKSIAECGLDFVKSEEIYSNENCEIDLTKLSKQIHAIRCISGWDGLGCTKSNQKVDGVDLKRIKVGIPNSKYTIIYAYKPDDNHDLYSEIDCPPNVSSQTLIYGLCKELALSQLQYDQYKIYKDRFDELLEKNSKPRSPSFPSRGWI